jgi:hypothetical protein
VVPCALTHTINLMVASKLKRRGWRRLPETIAFKYTCEELTTVDVEYVRGVFKSGDAFKG